MIDPKYFRAITAEARCRRGDFLLVGCRLAPFSFLHALQLEARRNPLATQERSPSPADYFEAAAICQEQDFMLETPDPTAEELAAFDPVEAARVWAEYIEVCCGSRPKLWQQDGKASHCKAPFEEFVATFILRTSNGYTRDQLFTMAIGKVMWIFESIVEQRGTSSRMFTPQDEAERVASQTEEAKVARAKREENFRLITKHVRSSRQRLALLAENRRGTLPKDWLKTFQAAKGKSHGRRR